MASTCWIEKLWIVINIIPITVGAYLQNVMTLF